mgnify:CR=1 FL=1
MGAFLVLGFVASMLLAGRMARDRHRSAKAWVWIAFIVGPLGPLALYILGNRPNGASHVLAAPKASAALSITPVMPSK